MILIDANLLLYAYDPRAPEHTPSKAWLETTLSGSQLVRFTWLTLWAFLRVATNPRVFVKPLTMAEATAIVSAWLARPVTGILEPGDRHWEILQRLAGAGQVSGAMTMDAVLAAIAIEYGATLYSTDRDFARFDELDYTNPLVPDGRS